MFATAYADERVEIAGHSYDFGDLVAQMDQWIFDEAQQWAGIHATRQAVVDEYLRLHRKRYGVPFAMPRT